MPASDIHTALARSLEGCRLLDHPFYRRWQAGKLADDELGSYAEQYRHFERALPEVLADVAAALPEGKGRELVESNLADELGRPRAHAELFESFAEAVGAKDGAAPTEATRALVELYRHAARQGPAQALAVIAAYEIQAGEVASTKADALAEHHALSSADREFWTVHANMEQAHADWTTDALVSLDAAPETVELWASRSATSWWSFLDERDASLVSL